jgi:exopolysaccharide production protein ExoZ
MNQPAHPARRDDLLTVQALRAIAALMVVAYHALDHWGSHVLSRPADAIWGNGSAGVDIFFVISGLVMTVSTRRIGQRPGAWWVFLRQRLTRIMPLYWVVTTAKIAAVITLPALATRTRLDLPYVLGSYALLPVRDPAGDFRPVLPVGWTLTYEMLFYLLVVLALALRLPILTVAAPMLTMFAAATVIQPGFSDTIVLEFLFGVGIGELVQQGKLRFASPAIPGALLIGGLAAILCTPVISGLLRPLIWGVPAACIVAGAVALERTLAPRLPRWLLAAGNGSYSTYLTHGFVVPLVFLLGVRAGLGGGSLLAATMVASLLASALVGQATHVCIERPLLHWLRRRPAVPTVAVAG